MKNWIIILFVGIIQMSFAQESDFFLWNNSSHQIYKSAKVKTVTVYTTDYDESGQIDEHYVSTIQTFAKNGDLMRELEYLGEDKSDGWSVVYTYNKDHQIIKIKSSWFDSENKKMEKYEYDAHHKLIKACEYIKKGSNEKYKPRNCKKFIYRRGTLKKVVSSKGNILFRYKKRRNGILEKYDHKDILRATFKNGLGISRVYDSDLYQYDYNSQGQMIQSIGKDKYGNSMSITSFIYTQGLLTEVIYKDKNGKVESIEKYEYQYYE